MNLIRVDDDQIWDEPVIGYHHGVETYGASDPELAELFPDLVDGPPFKAEFVSERWEVEYEWRKNDYSSKGTATAIALIVLFPFFAPGIAEAEWGEQEYAIKRHYVTFDIFIRQGDSWIKVNQREVLVDKEEIVDPVHMPKGMEEYVHQSSYKSHVYDEREEEAFDNFYDQWLSTKGKGSSSSKSDDGLPLDYEGEIVNVPLYATDLDPYDDVEKYYLLDAATDLGTGLMGGVNTILDELTPGQTYTYEELRRSFYHTSKLKDANGNDLPPGGSYEFVSLTPLGYPGRVRDRSKKIYSVILPHRTVRAYFKRKK